MNPVRTLKLFPLLAAAGLLAGECALSAGPVSAGPVSARYIADEVPSAGSTATPDEAPPSFDVPADPGQPLRFVVYGDTRFTRRAGDIVNPYARRELAGKIAEENPATILIGGDLVFEGRNTDDYDVYRSETAAWSSRRIPVFAALGNHEFRGCTTEDVQPCLENWWNAFSDLQLRGHRWYSVSVGPQILALILDSGERLQPGSEQRVWFEREITAADARYKFILVLLHYPPVRDPFYPRALDEKLIARYLSGKARALHAQVIVVGSHVHNYERYYRDGVTYLVSGGGGAKPVPAARLFGERSNLKTSVNYHYVRFVLDGNLLTGTMVRFDATVDRGTDPWSEPDRFEIRAKD
ncbi:MAG: metallophosphoesterase [Gammaproteobacteria bacterium]|nr:metallophosphoesterase [Gammaproteobacteria bacterium]